MVEGGVEVHLSLRQEGGTLGAYAVIGHVLWRALHLLSAQHRRQPRVKAR